MEFLALLTNLCPFVNLFPQWFGKLLNPNGHQNSFWLNRPPSVEVDLNQKLPPFIFVCTINRVCHRKFGYLDILNACFVCHQDSPLRKLVQSKVVSKGEDTNPPSSTELRTNGTSMASRSRVEDRAMSNHGEPSYSGSSSYRASFGGASSNGFGSCGPSSNGTKSGSSSSSGSIS